MIKHLFSTDSVMMENLRYLSIRDTGIKIIILRVKYLLPFVAHELIHDGQLPQVYTLIHSKVLSKIIGILTFGSLFKIRKVGLTISISVIPTSTAELKWTFEYWYQCYCSIKYKLAEQTSTSNRVNSSIYCIFSCTFITSNFANSIYCLYSCTFTTSNFANSSIYGIYSCTLSLFWSFFQHTIQKKNTENGYGEWYLLTHTFTLKFSY